MMSYSYIRRQIEEAAMMNPFVRKLQHGAELTSKDIEALEMITAEVQEFGSREDLSHEGDQSDSVDLVLEGFACRYRLLPSGEHQIVAFLLPGDLCNLHVSVLGQPDQSVATLSPCKIVTIPRANLEDLMINHPRINRALWWCLLVEQAILREWLVGLGRRSAGQRMAHLLCEFLVRFQAVGRATENSYDFPLNQAELADALGLSNVHVNRVLQQLRKDSLITLRGRRLTISHVERLKNFAEFDPNYLHLGYGSGPEYQTELDQSHALGLPHFRSERGVGDWVRSAIHASGFVAPRQ
jgi:CRP-like cAMP-binding protein